MQTFRKEERLSSKKLIELLFSEGKHFKAYPFLAVWLKSPEPLPTPVQVLITVSKKKFKKAVDRNRIKRITIEAYRLNKEPFYSLMSQAGECCLLAFIYTGSNLVTIREAEAKITDLLKRLRIEFKTLSDKEMNHG